MATSILEQDIRDFSARFKLAQELRGRHFAITGATGLLGSCMVRCLLGLDSAYALGIGITCVARDIGKAKAMFGDGVSLLEHDFAVDGTLELPDDVDYIVHFASPTASKYFVGNPVETIYTGFLGTRQVLETADKISAKVVYVSSLEVYGAIYDDSKPVTEDVMGDIDPMATRSSYPMVKRMSECLCKAFASERGGRVAVARLAQTFGAGVAQDDSRVFAQFARSVVKDEDIVLHTKGELSRCYCYTTDAIEGIFYILLRGKDGEAYNVSNDDTYISVYDMARLVCESFNPHVKPIIRLQDGMGYSPVTKLRLSSARLQSLGWTPNYGLKEMYQRLIESFR